MTSSISLRIHCLIMVLVLLIHILLLLPLMIEYRIIAPIFAPAPAYTQEELSHQEVPDDWAELKPRAGTFADVVFYDEPMQNAFVSSPSLTAPQEPLSPPEEEFSADTVSTDTDEDATQDTSQEVLLDQPPLLHELSVIINALPKSKTSDTTTNSASHAKKHVAPSSPPKKITLADITRGFLNQMRNDGNATIAMPGKKGGKLPPEQQIVYQRFLEKLHWQLQNSFKIHKHALALYESVKGVIEIYITFNPAQAHKDITLLRSCGSPILDHFMLFIVKDARNSFPPLPKNCDESLQSFSLIINIDIPHMTNGGAGLTFSLI